MENTKNCVVEVLIEVIEKKEQQRIVRNEYARTHYQRNKDKYKQKNKKYYEKNKDKCKERNKEYYEKNKDRKKQYWLEYAQKNKDKIRQCRAEYVKKIRDKIKKYDIEHYLNKSRISQLNKRRAKKGLELI